MNMEHGKTGGETTKKKTKNETWNHGANQKNGNMKVETMEQRKMENGKWKHGNMET